MLKQILEKLVDLNPQEEVNWSGEPHAKLTGGG